MIKYPQQIPEKYPLPLHQLQNNTLPFGRNEQLLDILPWAFSRIRDSITIQKYSETSISICWPVAEPRSYSFLMQQGSSLLLTCQSGSGEFLWLKFLNILLHISNRLLLSLKSQNKSLFIFVKTDFYSWQKTPTNTSAIGIHCRGKWLGGSYIYIYIIYII